MSCVIVAVFVCIVFPALLLLDRWLPLLIAIFKGDSSDLKWDILESGICEKNRDEWAPKPEPAKPIWNMTPEEKEAERQKRIERWRETQQRAQRKREGLVGVIAEFLDPPQYRGPQQPPVVQVQPNRPKPRKRTELDDLADELFAELD